MWKSREKNDRFAVQAINPKTKKFVGFIFGKDLLDIMDKAKLHNVKISGSIWMIPKGHVDKK